ncbi:MAG TPA: hypothetical protein PLT13_16140 [Spirochaetota bacterium]|nr:hypothetical protein [Spirochaetota bacterium]
MKRSLYISFFVAIISISSHSTVFAALTVDATFSDLTLNANISPLVETTVAAELAKYSYVPELTRGFGNANTYASHASTLRGYQNYGLYAISMGSMVSVQAPNSEPDFFKDIQDEMDKGDVYAGVGLAPLVVQAGINLDFLLEGLYVSFMFGKLKTNIDQGDFKIEHNANLIGGHVNYSLIEEKSILARALLWRGISIGAGFIHTDNSLEFYNKIDKITKTEVDGGGPGVDITYEIDPSVNFELDTKGNIIPVEIYTSARLFWFLNIGVGGGFDYVFLSRTDFKLSSAGDVVITNQNIGTNYIGQTGKITVDAETSGIESDSFRPKILANLGFSIGPAFIDIPASYYIDNGYSIGITAGWVW